jgi:guanylate kinase
MKRECDTCVVMIKEGSLFKRRGLMLVLSSPSGAGKTSIAQGLIELNPDLEMSISMTTRPRRPSEAEGRDYYFVSEEYFHKLCSMDSFLEYACVFDHYYGTPREPVEKNLAQGKDVLFDIDWQGTQSLSQAARGDLVTIFILPPSWQELERRLKERAQDSESTVAKRMAKAIDEMSHWAEYDYVLINDNLDTTVKRAHSILTAERLKRPRQLGLKEYVKSLKPL